MRRTITTQEELWAADSTRKTWLVELEPGAVLTGWQPAEPRLYNPLIAANTTVEIAGWADILAGDYIEYGAAGTGCIISAASQQTLHGGNPVRRWDIYTKSKPATLTSFLIQAWKWAEEVNGKRVLINRYSEEFINQLTDSDGIKSLVPAISYTPEPGDVIGVFYNFSGAAVDFLRLLPLATNELAQPYIITAAEQQLPTFTIENNFSTINNYTLAVKAYAQAPVAVHIADRAGYVQENYAWTWSMSSSSPMFTAFDPSCMAIHHLAAAFNWTYQNLSAAEATAGWAVTNFQQLVTDRDPGLLIISLGLSEWNDIPGFISDMTALLDLCTAEGINTAVTPILHQAADFPGGSEYKLIIDDMNSQLQALVAGYPAIKWLDSRMALCTADPAGPSGNLWYLQAAYTWNGWDLNAAGAAAWGQDMVAQLTEEPPADTYQAPWAGGLFSDFDFTNLQQDGQTLTRVASLAECGAASGRCYFNLATATLYARAFNDQDPATATMVLHFKQYLAAGASGSDKDECVFQPEGAPWPVNYNRGLQAIPSFENSLPDTLFGRATISIGTLQLLDFQDCIKNYIYFGKRCRCRVGGEDLPYSQYRMYWNGIMQSSRIQGAITEIEITDQQALLEKKLPEAIYTQAEFQYLEPSAEGRPIYSGYGILKNVKPTLINHTTQQYKLFVHHCGSIDALRFNGIDCTGTNLTQQDLPASTFVLYPWADGVVTCDCHAWADSQGNVPTLYGEIALALLSTALQDSDIDIAAFNAIDAERPYDCGLLISGEKINDILCLLDNTYLCFHGSNRSGQIFARLFDFGAPTPTANFINNTSCTNMTVRIDYSKIYRHIKFGYSKNWTIQTDTRTSTQQPTVRQDWSWDFKRLAEINNLTALLYGCDDTLVVDSLLADEAAAQAMAQLRAALHGLPWIEINFDCPLRPYSLSLGDFITVSGADPAPDGTIYMVTRLAEDPQTSVCAVRAIAPAAGYIG